jgi:chromosome segregation ATPase
VSVLREELDRWKILANERGFDLIAKEASKEQDDNEAAKRQVQLEAKEEIITQLRHDATEVRRRQASLPSDVKALQQELEVIRSTASHWETRALQVAQGLRVEREAWQEERRQWQDKVERLIRGAQ